MKLLVILLTLGLERFLQLGDFIVRFNWFEKYLDIVRKMSATTGLYQGVQGVAIVALPLLVLVAIAYYLFGWLMFHLVGFVVAVIVLLYCLGPGYLYSNIESYFMAVEKDDKKTVKKQLDAILEEKPKDEKHVNRAVTQSIFISFNKDIFAVLFWFVVLGPLGAVLYRVVDLTQKISKNKKSEHVALNPGAILAQDVLDWVPVRLLGLGYMLVGDFVHGFKYWMENVFSSFGKNREFAVRSGEIALNLNDKGAEKATVEENKEAFALVDRTLILYLVVIALFVLGAIVY